MCIRDSAEAERDRHDAPRRHARDVDDLAALDDAGRTAFAEFGAERLHHRDGNVPDVDGRQIGEAEFEDARGEAEPLAVGADVAELFEPAREPLGGDVYKRQRGPWWSTRPANIVLCAVLGTQALATLMAVYGLHIMTPIGWQLAGLVWGYAILCALLTDPVKLLAYRILDRPRATAPAPAGTPNLKPKVAAAT